MSGESVACARPTSIDKTSADRIFIHRVFIESSRSFCRTHWHHEPAKGSAAVLGCEFRRRLTARLIVERDARRTRRRDACRATARFLANRNWSDLNHTLELATAVAWSVRFAWP